MQVLLRWNVQHDISVIPKSTKEERIEENAGIWDWELPAEDFDTLSSLKKQVTFYLPISTVPCQGTMFYERFTILVLTVQRAIMRKCQIRLSSIIWMHKLNRS